MSFNLKLSNSAVSIFGGLAALVAGHYSVLYTTTCYQVPPGILVLVTCSWQLRAVGFALLAVLALGIPFLLGLRKAMWTSALPLLGYSLALMLWQSTRGQSFAYDLTYGFSTTGFFLTRVIAYWGVMVIAFATGRMLRSFKARTSRA